MSSYPDHSRAGNSRLSLFPSRLDRDRYPGNISTNTSDSFVGENFDVPTVSLGSNDNASHYRSMLDQGQGQQQDDVDLDDFGKLVTHMQTYSSGYLLG
jgi:hypothetical protein